MKPKIAVYYDSLWGKGGAERVTIELANHLNADIITCGVHPSFTNWLKPETQIVDIGNTLINASVDLGILIESPVRYSFFRPPKKYDIHLFLGFNSIYAAQAGQKNIWFCFTPNRMLYDHKLLKRSTGSLAKQQFFKLYQSVFTKKDQKAVSKIHTIVAQTKTVQKRITQYYNRSSIINHSPVDTSTYYFKDHQDFFLTVGRLVPEKRIVMIAEAFSKVPNRKLIIVGDGPEREKIHKILEQHSNIKYIRSTNEKQLKELYATCLATVYMPMEEDFGLVPIEGMASGKVSIVANEGGCLETVKNEITGKIISPDLDSLVQTLELFDDHWAKRQKNACLTHAKLFDTKKCISKWHQIIESVDNSIV